MKRVVLPISTTRACRDVCSSSPGTNRYLVAYELADGTQFLEEEQEGAATVTIASYFRY